MSLLMEALKRAEEAKRQVEGGKPGETGAHASETVGGATRLFERRVAPLPDLPGRLELLDEQFDTAPRQPPPEPVAADAEKEREAARNLFAAKPTPVPSRRGFYLALGLLTLIAAAGIGSYVWLETQTKSGIGGPIGPQAMSARAVGQPAAPAQVEPAGVPQAPTSGGTLLRPPSTPAPGGEVRSVAVTRGASTQALPPNASREVPAVSESGTRAQSATPRETPAGATATEPRIPIRVGAAKSQVDPLVMKGYDSYMAGDLAAARTAYDRVLLADRHNRDALHGLAAVSLAEGDSAAAQEFYLRILEADPRDPLAAAALVRAQALSDPVQAESRLKGLIGQQPDAHFAHFALGNVYAAQERWPEAQQAYFRAHVGDSGNPDYQFNLAVSLEHLRQPALALRYYEGAMHAARNRPAAFEPAGVAARIRELAR